MEYRKQQFLTYDEFTRQFACDYAMPLARGGHGEIYRGVDLETNEEVAIKRRLYSVDDNALTLEKEYAHTQAVPVNRFVVRYLYYGRYVTPFGTYEFLVMRYYRDGNLTNNALSWSALSVLQQQRFVSEFLLGLSHLHTHGIVHRDIKPENVLLVRYSDPEGIAFRPVIVDFGISKMMTDYPEAAKAFVQNSMRIGTVTYMAPEQLRTENIDYNADLWSFGIILYELITGKHMIARKSFPETQREEAYAFWRMAGDERFPDDLRAIPQPYQQLIRKCLIVNTDERVQSARDLLDLLEFQPRIAEAEKAFRRQNWEAVIEALEPIVDRAEIPELNVWLQQARMHQALSKPMGVLVSEPPTSEFEDDFTRILNPTPEEELPEETPLQDRTPEHTPDLPVRTPEVASATEADKVVDDLHGAGQTPVEKPVATVVPYTDKTELFDEPVQASVGSQPVTAKVASSPAETKQEPDSPEADEKAEVEEKADESTDVPAASDLYSLSPDARNSDSATDDNVPTQEVVTSPAADVTPSAVDQSVRSDGDVPAPGESETDVPGKAEAAPLQRTEVFGEDDLAKSQADQSSVKGPSQQTEMFDEVLPVLGKAPSPTPATGPATPPAATPTPPEPLPGLKRDEALPIEPATNVPAATAGGVPPLPSPADLTNVPREQKSPKTPVTPPGPSQPSLLDRILEKLNDVDVDDLKKQANTVYQSAKQSKNRPLVVGGAVALFLLLLFAIDSGSNQQDYAQLDPNESHAVSLKRFHNYLHTYEKTGNLDQYVWAFVHCNPIYEDSLSRTVFRRAQTLQLQNETLFPGYKGSVWNLKLKEMKDTYRDKRNWERHRNSLSDENCVPVSAK